MPEGAGGSPGVAAVSASDCAVAGGSKGRVRLWLAVAVVVLVVGTVGSVIAADSQATNGADRSRREFKTASAEIASTLQLAIQREEDLVVSAGAFVVGDPNATNAQFAAWMNSVGAFPRYPELIDLGLAVQVSASELPAFAARMIASPPGQLAANGSFQVVPAGDRPFYCLLQTQTARSAATQQPAGLDFCTTEVGPVALSARDSGRAGYVTFQVGTDRWLILETPVYRDGVVPATVEQRRQSFLGWVGAATVPKVILDRALQGHSGLAMSLRYQQGSANVVFPSGTVPRGARSVTTGLGDGWTVETFGVVAAGGVLANGTALGLLLTGLALSVLLGLLVMLLATGRARALGLVSQKTDELRHQAVHDALTGLPNRTLIMDRIEQLLARNRRNGSVGAALYVDLDGFKNVNDTLGHGVGDRLLQAVAARLTATLRDADTIGRMGGDEFVVLIDGVSSTSAPELVADRLLEVMGQPFEVDGAAAALPLTASVGIAVGYRQTPGELLRDADVALYQAKARGRNCYVVFRPEMGTDVQYRYELEFDLRGALEAEQFRLVYQPIYDLDDLTLIGVEALIRWQHPSLGQIQPDQFIPLLESSGQIMEVGRWVLLEACQQMRTWRDRGSDLMVSVNVSGRQLDHDVIVEDVLHALEVSGLDASSLTIEVTETALMRDIETTAGRLRQLKALGVQVAIDDFGTGYSSLAYLQRLPVDCLKIDRTFTDAITRSTEAHALIRTLVQLGRDLGLKTLAEGVETTEQIDHLRGQQVDQVQGFLLARPLAADTLETQVLEPARAAEPRRPQRAQPSAAPSTHARAALPAPVGPTASVVSSGLTWLCARD